MSEAGAWVTGWRGRAICAMAATYRGTMRLRLDGLGRASAGQLVVQRFYGGYGIGRAEKEGENSRA